MKTHCVYRHYDADGNLLYVGCAKDVKARQSGHKATSKWFPLVDRIDVSEPMEMKEAFQAEREAIWDENPDFNLNRYPWKNKRRRKQTSN